MKEKNEGCRSVAAGSSGFRRALCLCGLIASMSQFEVLTASVSGCQPIVVSVCVCLGGLCSPLEHLCISGTHLDTPCQRTKGQNPKRLFFLMSSPMITCNCAHKHHTTQSMTCKTKQSRMSPSGRTLHFRGNFILCHKIALGSHHSYATKCSFLGTHFVMLIMVSQ